jgi:hypothetical protein
VSRVPGVILLHVSLTADMFCIIFGRQQGHVDVKKVTQILSLVVKETPGVPLLIVISTRREMIQGSVTGKSNTGDLRSIQHTCHYSGTLSEIIIIPFPISRLQDSTVYSSTRGADHSENTSLLQNFWSVVGQRSYTHVPHDESSERKKKTKRASPAGIPHSFTRLFFPPFPSLYQ